jgi:threonine synthase
MKGGVKVLEKYKKEIEKEIDKEIDKEVNEIVEQIMRDFKGDIKKKKKIKKIMKIFYRKVMEEIKKISWELHEKGEVSIYIDENKIDKKILQKLKEGNWSPRKIEVWDKEGENKKYD